MKRTRFVLVLLLLAITACGSGSASVSEGGPTTLQVSDGTSARTYTVADLEKLPASESTFNEVTYKGVALPTLLEDAGFDVAALKSVKALASDGYSVNYEPALFQRDDVLVAYATASGPLAADDGIFRMVLPGQEGKMNVRMLTEVKITP